MSERPSGYIAEDGNHYEFPPPMMDRNVSDQVLQEWINASYHVVDSGFFSDNMVAYHQHLLDTYYSEILQERSWKGRRRR